MPKLAMSAMLVLSVLIVGGRRADAGLIANGGFETGDLTGWSVNDSSLTSAEFSVAQLGGGGTYFPPTPDSGDYFAYLLSGIDVNIPTILYQDFTASAGSVLSFDIFFDTAEEGPDRQNDFGAAILQGATTGSAILFFADVDMVGDLGTTGWVHISYTILNDDSYSLGFLVLNSGDNDTFFNSALGVDNVSLAVPEPSSLAMSGVALCLWAGRRLRRRKTAV